MQETHVEFTLCPAPRQSAPLTATPVYNLCLTRQITLSRAHEQLILIIYAFNVYNNVVVMLTDINLF